MSSDSQGQLPENITEAERISRELVNAKADLQEIKYEIEDTDDNSSIYDDEIRAAEIKLRQLRQQKFAEANKIAGLRSRQSKLSQRVKDLENDLHRANREAMKRDEWNRRTAEIDEFAKMFPWFGAIKKHQFDAAKQLTVIGGKGILADKRGLGKSLTALATCDLLKASKVIIISKGEILRNFYNEIHKWYAGSDDQRPIFSLVSENKQTRDLIVDTIAPMSDRFFLLVNFESWWRDKSLIQRIAKLQPDTILIDEAHHAKEVEKNNFRGLRTLIYNKNKCPECGGRDVTLFDAPVHWVCNTCKYIANDKEFMSVKNVIPMTGSPIMNRPEEFFALLHMIDPIRFVDKRMFLDQYCQQVDHVNLMGRSVKRWDFRYGGSARLLESIGPQFIQRDRKTAGVEIPDQEIQYHYLEFDREKYPRQAKAYRQIKDYMGALFDKDNNGYIVATQASSIITRLRQVTSWPMGIKVYNTLEDGTKELAFQCDIDESVKLDKAVELASEIVGEGERVVIFSKFTAVLEELKRRFDATKNTDEKVRAAIYYGKTPIHQRDRIKLDFDISTYDSENYEYDVVLCQYQSAGEGLNFNAATQMIFVEREWNPEKEGQATGRIQRFGQTQETTVHVLELENTIDTRVSNLLATKENLVGDFESNAQLVMQVLQEEMRDS